MWRLKKMRLDQAQHHGLQTLYTAHSGPSILSRSKHNHVRRE
jgi:hypothetical protein